MFVLAQFRLDRERKMARTAMICSCVRNPVLTKFQENGLLKNSPTGFDRREWDYSIPFYGISLGTEANGDTASHRVGDGRGKAAGDVPYDAIIARRGV